MEPPEFGAMLRKFVVSTSDLSLHALNAKDLPSCIAIALEFGSRAKELQTLAAELPAEASGLRDDVRLALEDIQQASKVASVLQERESLRIDPERTLLMLRPEVYNTAFSPAANQLQTLATKLLLWLPAAPSSMMPTERDSETLASGGKASGLKSIRQELDDWDALDGNCPGNAASAAETVDDYGPGPAPPFEEFEDEQLAEMPPGGDVAGGGRGETDGAGKTPDKAGGARKPVEPSGDKRKAQRCQVLAYYASRYAELKLEQELTAQEAYDYWKEYGFDPADKNTENAAELAGYELPDSFPTYQSQLSHGRREFKDSRYENRNGRQGRSIVRSDEID